MRRLSAFVFVLIFAPFVAAAGSQTYSTPGTHSFTVPAYGTLTVQVWGGGGGGGGGGEAWPSDGIWVNYSYDGSAGSTSSFAGTVAGYGGGGGQCGAVVCNTGPAYGDPSQNWNGAAGSGGSASGGTTNTTGSSGSAGGSNYVGGAGGSSPNGGGSGSAPGGGGPGGQGWNGSLYLSPGSGGGGGGGGGGYSTRAYASGALTQGASIAVVVGSGGSGGASGGSVAGTAGGAGRVTITWTDPAPSCSVTAVVNPLSYGNSTTLQWSSSNATTMYIANVGYVTPNTTGSATVGPLTSTAYDGTAVSSVGTTNCNFTLTVSSPPAPTCSVSVSPTSLYEGQSTTLEWTSSNTTSCTGTNFSTGGATSGETEVSPSSSTTYTASCTGAGGTVQCSGTGDGGEGAEIEVLAQCTPATMYSCSGQTIQETQTTMYCEDMVTDVTTCETPNFCTAGSATCLSAVMSGSISASPRLLALGKTSAITWSAEHAESCTVTGNGDSWTGISGNRTSSPVTMFATYTLSCTNSIGTEDIDSVSIMRLPDWRER